MAKNGTRTYILIGVLVPLAMAATWIFAGGVKSGDVEDNEKNITKNETAIAAQVIKLDDMKDLIHKLDTSRQLNEQTITRIDKQYSEMNLALGEIKTLILQRTP